MYATSRVGAWALVALLLSRGVVADSWYVDGSVQVDGGYDDNPLLLSDNEEGVFGTTVTPSLTLGWFSPNISAGVDLALPYSAFSGDGIEGDGGDLDSFDQHAGSFLTLSGALTELSLDARYDRDTTRTSELTDTGLLSGSERRERLSGAVGVLRRLTPVDSLSLNVGAEDVSYETDLLTEFRAYTGEAEYLHDIDPRTQVGLELRVTRFEPESTTEGNTHAVGLQALASYAVSPTLDLSLGAGPSYVTRDTTSLVGGVPMSDTEDSVGGLFDVAIDWRLSPLDELHAFYSRSLQPSATGVLRTTDAVGIDYSRILAPDWTFAVGGRFLHQEAATGGGAGAARQYAAVEPVLSWRFLPQWALSASYRFRWQDRGAAGTAQSNAFFVTLQYSAPRLTLD